MKLKIILSEGIWLNAPIEVEAIWPNEFLPRVGDIIETELLKNLIDWDKVVVEDALEKCLPAYKEWGYLYLSSRNSNYSHAESMKRMLDSYLGNIKYVESLTWRMEAGKIYPVIRMAHRSPEEELWRRLGNEFECIKGLLEQHRSKLERTYQSIHCKQ